MKELDAVCRARIFEQLTRDEVSQVLQLLQPRRKELKKGNLLINDGAPVEDIYIVLSGTLAATKLYADGHESLLEKFFPAYVIGYDIVTTKTQRSTCFVTALQDVQVLSFKYQKLRDPGLLPESLRLKILDSMIALIAGESVKKTNKIEILSRKGMRDRIMTYLSLQSNFHQSREFDIPFNRQELADYLCLNRSKLSYELSQMQAEGLIRYKKNHFEVIGGILYRYK